MVRGMELEGGNGWRLSMWILEGLLLGRQVGRVSATANMDSLRIRMDHPRMAREPFGALPSRPLPKLLFGVAA
jgi:hypothetical protein